LEQGRQLGRTGIEVNAILGVNAIYVPIGLNLNSNANNNTSFNTLKESKRKRKEKVYKA
jgi:hypothetical protein